jgi:hypothetical protein
MRHVVLAALVLTVPAVAARAQTRDDRLEALVTAARSLPAEFSADTLIRIAGSARVADPHRKIQLLDEAFFDAYGAQAQYRQTSLHVPLDSRQFALSQAADTPLARITLQARATQLMATLDPRRARELFEWIDINLAPATCDGVLVPAADEYYTTLSLLARTAFPPSDRGGATQFLEYYLWRAHLPTEMPAVALAVERFHPTVAESTYLEGMLTWLMDSGSSDPRGFSTANVDIVGRFADLQHSDHDRGVAGWWLMDGLRKYLVKHLGGPRCSDSATENMLPGTFNLALRLLRADDDVKPIDGSQIRPARLVKGTQIEFYWQTPPARSLFQSWMHLHGPGTNPLPESERRAEGWRNEADRFITDLEQWSGRSERSENDYFYEKSTLYANLVGVMPPSPVRVRAVRSFVDFLRHEDTDRSRRPLWFVFVNRLIELARTDVRAEILDTMDSRGGPVLSVYARLERLTPPGER